MSEPGSARRAPSSGDSTPDEVKASGYELFVLLCSILSIVNLVIVAFPDLGPIQQVAC